MSGLLPRPLIATPPAQDAATRPMRPGPRIVIAVSGALSAIPWCLAALRRQRTPEGLAPARGSFGVVIAPVLAPPGDPAAARAVLATMAESLPFPLRLALPTGAATAASAWREAMAAAADWAGPQGILLATPAEAVPAPGWLAAHLAAIGDGADAAVGEGRRPGAAGRYGLLLRHIALRLDPMAGAEAGIPDRAEDPLASLAVTVAALAGQPLPAGGPGSLLTRLRQRDARIDRLADGLVDGPLPVPERLGPACRRWRCRAALRVLWEAGTGSVAPETPALRRWAQRLGLPAGALAGLLRARHFGTAWARVEQASPLLRPLPLPAAGLPLELARARLLLAWLRLTRPAQRATPGGGFGGGTPGICPGICMD